MKAIRQFLNLKMDMAGFSAQVFVVGTILSATFFLLLLDSFKTYRSDISILVNAKSPVAISKESQLVSNIVEFPKMLSFYDRLLKYNSDVRDVTKGMPADERKQIWNEMISVKRADKNASVFEIYIVAKRQADAEQLAEKSARTLFDTVAFYYDIKKDVDLRIVEGPITKSQIPGWPLIMIVSVVGGFAVAMFLNFMLLVGGTRLREKSELLFKKNSFFDFKKKTEIPVEEELESLRSLYDSEPQETPFVFEEKEVAPVIEEKKPAQDLKLQEMKKITKKFEPGKYPNYAELPVRENHVASAPDNLPIADDVFPMVEQEAPTVEEVAEEIEKREPTPEELKKRLNQLLRGEL